MINVRWEKFAELPRKFTALLEARKSKLTHRFPKLLTPSCRKSILPLLVADQIFKARCSREVVTYSRLRHIQARKIGKIRNFVNFAGSRKV